MISSMTGFGRSQQTVDELNITVELKSVNHRFFEWNARVPRSYLFLDEKLKSYCRSRIVRGKIEMFVTVEGGTAGDTTVDIDRALAATYIEALKKLSEEFDLKDDISVTSVARYNDIFIVSKNEINEEELTNAIMSVAQKAVDSFIEMRNTEGARLKKDIENRVSNILEKLVFIEERSPETVRLYRERLEQKITDLLSSAQIDEQRVITETAIFADKVAIDEETVRLRSHIKQLCDLMERGGDIGKKLDFIVQEMNRETNTIGSKCQDAEISQRVVDIKSEIEKIREQVQNIE